MIARASASPPPECADTTRVPTFVTPHAASVSSVVDASFETLLQSVWCEFFAGSLTDRLAGALLSSGRMKIVCGSRAWISSIRLVCPEPCPFGSAAVASAGAEGSGKNSRSRAGGFRCGGEGSQDASEGAAGR